MKYNVWCALLIPIPLLSFHSSVLLGSLCLFSKHNSGVADVPSLQIILTETTKKNSQQKWQLARVSGWLSPGKIPLGYL
jgi:hypothetical protein